MKKLSINKIFITIFTITMICSLFLVYKVGAQTKDLKISNVEIKEKSSGVTGDITSSSSDEINDTITFHKLNDYVIYKIKIDNNLDSDITIKTISDNNQNAYITYEYNKHENEVIDSKGSLELLIKVKYSKELTDTTKRDQTSSVRLSITYEENGKTKNTNLIINPKTYDNLSTSVVLFIISSAGLMICLTKNKKGIKNIIIVTATTILLTPAITKAVNLDLNFDFKTELKIYDKVVLTYVVDNEEKQITIPYGTSINDIDFGFDAGYSVTNWKLEDNLPIFTNMIISEDIKIVGSLSYTAKPSISLVNRFNFSYTAPNAKAYYVSTSETIPSISDIQDSFALNTWTTAITTNFNRISSKETYYVYVIDNNDELSSEKGTISTYALKIIYSSGAGAFVNYNENIMEGWSSIGMGEYNLSPSGTHTLYIFEGQELSIDGYVTKGFENIIMSKNGSPYENKEKFTILDDTDINIEASPKNYTLSINPNGSTYNNSTEVVTKTVIFGSDDNKEIGVPIKDGYTFKGWYDSIVGGENVFNSTGKQVYSKYWKTTSYSYGAYTRKWVYDGDATVYPRWSTQMDIEVNTIDYNTFSYSAPNAVAYFVSTSNFLPSSTSDVQTNFELNKWTSATSTGDLDLSSTSKYYIWAITEDGIISDQPAQIAVRTIKKSDSSFIAEVKSNDENGELITLDLSSPIKALNNSKLYMNFIDVSCTEYYVWSWTGFFSSRVPSAKVYTITDSYDLYTADAPFI